MSKIKLEVEMIPSTNFYNNVRSAVSKTQWDILRKDCYEKANNKCEICGSSGLEQGYRHSTEAHEVWNFDFLTNTQHLVRLIALCPRCHFAKHIGRTFAIGKQDEVFKHMEYVNNWTHKDVVNYLAQVFIEHRVRSQQIWKLDLSYLDTEYGIKITQKQLDKASKAKPKTTYYYNKTKKKNNLKRSPKSK